MPSGEPNPREVEYLKNKRPIETLPNTYELLVEILKELRYLNKQ